VETRSTGQCLWVNADTQPVWNVTITGNHFQGAGTGTLAVLVAPVGAVQLQNNVFDGGHVGLNLELLASRITQVHPIALQVANKSFCDCRSWIGLMHTEPAATPLTLANNLILDCETVEASDAQQRALVEHGVVGGNVWERPPQESALPQALQRWARVEPTVVVQSRDPADDAFLRLPADSPLKSAGAGGDLPAHVGARP
jgi:hypothetical protein